eukprot:scaffold1508_cov110-Isochrysis_galbana.AAC.3
MALAAMPRRHPLLRQSARRQMASPLARQRVRISCPHHPHLHLARLDPIRTTTSPATTTTCPTNPTSPAPTTAPVGARHSLTAPRHSSAVARPASAASFAAAAPPRPDGRRLGGGPQPQPQEGFYPSCRRCNLPREFSHDLQCYSLAPRWEPRRRTWPLPWGARPGTHLVPQPP